MLTLPGGARFILELFGLNEISFRDRSMIDLCSSFCTYSGLALQACLFHVDKYVILEW